MMERMGKLRRRRFLGTVGAAAGCALLTDPLGERRAHAASTVYSAHHTSLVSGTTPQEAWVQAAVDADVKAMTGKTDVGLAWESIFGGTLPASASASIRFPGHSWVGMATSLGDAGDHFGFEDSAATLQVEGGTTVDGAVLSDAAPDGPGTDGALQTDAGLAGREAGPGLQARDTLTGGCAVAPAAVGGASAVWVLLGLGLLWRRWRCGPSAV